MITLSLKAHVLPLPGVLARAVRAAWKAFHLACSLPLLDCIRAPERLEYPPSARAERLMGGARAGDWL